jgi:hypothetical protein
MAPPASAGSGADCPRRGAHYNASKIVTRRAGTRTERGAPARGGARSAVERDRPAGRGLWTRGE